jgi:hypothetical protein
MGGPFWTARRTKPPGGPDPRCDTVDAVRTSGRTLVAGLVFLGAVGLPWPAWAQNSAATPSLAPDAQVTIATTPPEGKTGEADSTLTAAPPEAPPPRPRRKGLVLESTAGVLGFAGALRHVAPPGYWMHIQLGYELLRWLMVFADGELSFTDTSVSQGSQEIAFPIYCFGAGLRATVHVGDRLAVFVQGQGGELTAYVPRGALTDLGYRNAESLNGQFGGRIGVEWYQVDRHLALTAQAGARDALGFARVVGGPDLPLMWDGAAGLRYTF